MVAQISDNCISATEKNEQGKKNITKFLKHPRAKVAVAYWLQEGLGGYWWKSIVITLCATLTKKENEKEEPGLKRVRTEI